MKTGASRLVVVDASVVCAAGETEHPISSASRKTLTAIRDICHRIALTRSIRDEWKKHASLFSRKWLGSMVAKRKVSFYVQPTNAALERLRLPNGARRAVEKDLCLIETALSADRVIVTLDEKLKKHLCKTREGKRFADEFTWINPYPNGADRLAEIAVGKIRKKTRNNSRGSK
jgi:rRNA-processing protein FCF1